MPDEIDFHKTIIAGFPSGDKRMIFVQMEALTGWRKSKVFHFFFTHTKDSVVSLKKHVHNIISAAKDEWDFEHIGMSNHPFIKANYPHHEGVWGWEDVADQVVMMV